MIYEMLFSIIGILIVLLYIMYDKYSREHKRAESWKSDYEACLKNYNEYKRFKYWHWKKDMNMELSKDS